MQAGMECEAVKMEAYADDHDDITTLRHHAAL